MQVLTGLRKRLETSTRDQSCEIEVENFDPPAASGEVGEVCDGQGGAELDLEVREEGAAAGEDGQQVGNIVPGPDTQPRQLTTSPAIVFI